MNILIQEIQADIDWRISELATIKTLPVRYNMLDYHVKSLTVYSVPSIYAIWEGFIKNSLGSYASFINKKNLKIDDLDINILTHAVDVECHLNNGRSHWEKQRDFVTQIMGILNNNPINIKTKVPTKSNVGYRVTNTILDRFNLEPLDTKFQYPLDDLLKVRNRIAHGENSVVVKKEHIEKFTLLIGELMDVILLKIEDAIKNEKYKYIP
ncbi:MAG: hypothetical protein K8E24_009300 [Methanobacterium paludis]|nr:hypothetical protein [Methanobacterium paludis]